MTETRVDLVGFDLSGFSRAFERLVAASGAAAAERIADALTSGEAAVAAQLAPFGFTFADTTGDGGFFVRPSSASPDREARNAGDDPQAAIADAVRALGDATGLHVRSARVLGHAARLALAAGTRAQTHLWIGEGVVALHRALARAPRGQDAETPFPILRRDVQGAFLGEKAATGEIADAAIAYCRLWSPDAALTRTSEALIDAIQHVGEAALLNDARLARVSLDDKGLLARLEFDGAGLEARRFARAAAEEISAALLARGHMPAFGLAAGPVYRGPLGLGGRNTHGACVNLAAKRAAAAADGDILADPSFLQSTPGVARTRTREPHAVERSELHLTRTRLAEGERLIMLEGEAGIGKSETLRALAKVFAEVRHPHVLLACRQERRLAPLDGLISIARKRRALVGAEGARAVAHPMFPDAVKDQESEAAEGVVALCIDEDLDFDAARKRLRVATPRLEPLRAAVLERIVGAGSLTLLIDDIAFLDTPSRIGLEHVARSDAGVAVVATRRTSRASDAGDARGESVHTESARADDARPEDAAWRRVALQPLDDAHMDAMLAPLAAGDHTLARTARDIAGGNPLLATQAVLALQDAPIDAAHARDVHAVIGRRMGELGAGETLLMRAAAAARRPLAAQSLADICARVAPDISVTGAQERLIAKRLLAVDVAEAAESAGRLAPVHALVIDVTRQRTPRSVARAFAVAAARQADADTGHGAKLDDGARADFWRAADSPARAAILSARAGRAALDLGAHEAARAHYDRALEAAGATLDARRARWRADRAVAGWGLGQITRAAQDADACLSLRADRRMRTRDPGALLQAAVIRAETAQFQGDLGAIVRANRLSWRFARAPGDRLQALGRSYAFLGYLLGLARLAPVSRAIHDAGARLDHGGDRRPAAFALAARGVLELAFGRWSQAYKTLDAAHAACAAPREPHLQEVVETLKGLGFYFSGRFTAAAEAYERLDTMAAARGHDLHRGWAAYARAQTRLARGDPGGCLSDLDIAARWLAADEDAQSRIICAGVRPQALWAAGRREEATASAIAALRIDVPPTNFGSLEGYAGPAHILAMTLAHTSPDTPSSARNALQRHARKARARLEAYALVFPIGRPRAATVKAWLFAGASPDAARTAARRARRLAVRYAMPLEARHARAAHAFVSTRPS